ncbi:MAG: metallophosphoesterase [Gudongella sp.]|jgi:predicted phosphodiesterase|nr:metallophosphoesterase [Gudongella sp.]
MQKFNKLFDSLRGRIDINNSLVLNKNPLLLHISDTPSQFYPELKRIIKLINPQYIIHTGDLADNIKCEFKPSLLTKYKHEVKKLLKILNSSNTENIYLTLGNHDDYDFINKNKGRMKLYENVGEISINSLKLLFSHYPDYIKTTPADIYLFGHDIVPQSVFSDLYISLNGVNSINIINLETLEITCLNYPLGTNEARLNKNKIGI